MNSTDYTLPYIENLDTSTLPNGTHQLSVIAYDISGNQSKSQISIVVNNPVRIHSANTSVTDVNGLAWTSDINFVSGSSNFSSVTSPIMGTQNPKLYQSERYGNAFGYQFSVPNGNYTAILKFAETYWTNANQRVFNVAVNGKPVVSNLDIFSKVGGNAAYDVSVPVLVSNGQIQINLTTIKDNAKICAIEIIPLNTLEVVAGRGSAIDSNYNVWLADTGYSSGTSTDTVITNISNTADPELYQSERYGKSFSYRFSVNNGIYQVTLKFAETYWTTPNQRVFDVAINGQSLITHLDIVSKVGAATAYDVTFPVVVTQGQILMQFTAVIDNAKVSAIKISPMQ